MVEFHLDPEAARRLLETVAATVTRKRPLTPERAGALQAIATRIGLSFQDVARLTEAPKIRKPLARAEAEAMFLAAAMVMNTGERSEKETKTLRALGGAMDLGLAAAELERLAAQPDALRLLKPRASSSGSEGAARPLASPPRQPSETLPLTGPPLPLPGQLPTGAEGAVAQDSGSGSDTGPLPAEAPGPPPPPQSPAPPPGAPVPPPHTIPPIEGLPPIAPVPVAASAAEAAAPAPGPKKKVARRRGRAGGEDESTSTRSSRAGNPWLIPGLVGATVLILGGILLVALFSERGPPPPPPAAAQVEALKARYNDCVERYKRMSDTPAAASFAEVAEVIETLEVLEEELEPVDYGDAPLMLRETRTLLASSGPLLALRSIKQGELLQRTQEQLEALSYDGQYVAAKALLDGLPESFKRREDRWVAERYQELEGWSGFATKVREFLNLKPAPKGLTALEKGLKLHQLAERQGHVNTKPHAELIEWFGQRRTEGAAVLGEELRSLGEGGQPGRPEKVARWRTIFELLFPDLSAKHAFYAEADPELVHRLLEQQEDERRLELLQRELGPQGWARLEIDKVVDLFREAEGQVFVRFTETVPAGRWVEVDPNFVLQRTRSLTPQDHFVFWARVGPRALDKISTISLAKLLKPYPVAMRQVFYRLLGPEQVAKIRAELGEPPPSEAAPEAGPDRPVDPIPEGSVSQGTGFYVTPRHVVTNAHVVGREQRIRLVKQGVGFPGRVTARSGRFDLALIQTETQGRPLLLGEAAIRRNEPAWAYGFGSGLKQPVLLSTRGSVAAITEKRTQLVFDAHVNPGNSGGPLVDALGSFLGVITAKSAVKDPSLEDSLGLAVDGRLVAAWLSQQGVTVQRTPRTANPNERPPDDMLQRAVVLVLAGSGQ